MKVILQKLAVTKGHVGSNKGPRWSKNNKQLKSHRTVRTVAETAVLFQELTTRKLEEFFVHTMCERSSK